MESKRKRRRSVVLEKAVFPKNRHGSLSAADEGMQKIAYPFDKMTLSEDKVLNVYLYGGRRTEESVE